MAKAPEKKSGTKSKVPEDDPFIAEVIKRVSSVVGRDRAAQVAAQVVPLYQQQQFYDVVLNFPALAVIAGKARQRLQVVNLTLQL